MPDCPICGKPTAPSPRLRPFCSARCAEVDLGRWFTGSYSIPAPTSETDDDPDADPLDPRPGMG